MNIVLLLVVVIFSGILFFQWHLLTELRRKNADLRAEIAATDEENNNLRAALEEEKFSTRILEHEIEAGKQIAKRTEELVEKTRQSLCEKFESMSHEAFFRSQRSFFETAKETFQQYHALIASSVDKKQAEVSSVIMPLRASLEQMEKKVQELELVRRGAYDGLTQQLHQLSTVQMSLQKETANLVKALRDPTVRGRWGEIQLRRVVEVAGMLSYCDFEEQVCVEKEDVGIRPDMVVRLPNNRVVVIDAKVSLGAYLDAVNAETPEARVEKLVQHAKHVRQHVVRLAQKRYWDQFSQTPDFVVLFLHGDCFLAPALEHDAELLEFASSQKVLLATPTSLIAMLKVIAYSWGEAKIEQHAQLILDEAKTWIERCSTFAEHFCEVGKHLERSVRAYDKAVGSFENRLLVSLRRLSETGLDTSELPIPEALRMTPAVMQIEGSANDRPLA